MSYRFRELFLSLTIVAMLLFSAVGTTAVYADDGTPPTPTPEAGTTPGQDGSTGTEAAPPSPTEEVVVPPVAPTEEVVPPVAPTDEVVPPTEEVVPPVAPTEEVLLPVTPTEEVVPSTDVTTEVAADPILAQVPENTTVTVIDAEGVAQPLASQESADAIATTTDPIWCPATQTTPTPGLNGCTASFTSFNDLLSFVLLHEVDPAYSFQQAGTIYIEQGAYAGGETSIDFNNYAFTQFNTQDLTLQGGWNPADNSVASTSQFTAPIIIGSSTNPWVGSLTINDISISGASGDTGLTINTTGAVTINDSSFSGNEAGLQIDTPREASLVNVKADNNHQSGAQIKAGDVAIDTASFSNNGASGLDVTSQVAIALFGVSANNNKQFGANIFAGDLVAVAQSNFNDNGDYGLRVVTTSLIAVEDVNANNNADYGAYLEGSDTVVNNSFFTANGSLGVVSEPIGYGLKIVSTGTVNLTNINAADSVGNQLFGADITAAKNVDISDAFFSGQQSEIFNKNNETTAYYGYGLNVVTPGDIFLDYVVGNYNNLWGANLTGNDVAVYNSQFNNNITDSIIFIDDTGLLVNATGLVDIYRTEAKENRLIGATITAVGDVFVTESDFSDNRGMTCDVVSCQDFVAHGYGLNVFTSGNIFVNGTIANNNFLFGATLNGANVEVVNSSFNFNGSCIVRPTQTLAVNCINLDPTGQGLNVISSGNTSLVNVSASNNELFGANVQAVGNVTVTGSVFSGNKSYTYYDDGSFDVHGYGLKVTANGAILLNADAKGVGNTASDNNLNGAILISQGLSTVTVSDSIFNNNGTSGVSNNNGLTITVAPTGGSVTLNNVTATNTHGQDGVRVNGVCANTVFVNGGIFTDNARNGIRVKTALVLDGLQTFANNVGGDISANSACPPVVVPPVVVPPVVVPPVVVLPVVVPPIVDLPVVVPPVVDLPVVIPPVVDSPVDNNTTSNDTSDTTTTDNTASNNNPSNTTISNGTNSNTTTWWNKDSDNENKKDGKGDKNFKFGKHGFGKIKMRGHHHFHSPCILKVIPI